MSHAIGGLRINFDDLAFFDVQLNLKVHECLCTLPPSKSRHHSWRGNRGLKLSTATKVLWRVREKKSRLNQKKKKYNFMACGYSSHCNCVFCLSRFLHSHLLCCSQKKRVIAFSIKFQFELFCIIIMGSTTFSVNNPSLLSAKGYAQELPCNLILLHNTMKAFL